MPGLPDGGLWTIKKAVFSKPCGFESKTKRKNFSKKIKSTKINGVMHVLILYGNLDRGVHVLNEIGNMICLRNLLRSTAVTNLK